MKTSYTFRKYFRKLTNYNIYKDSSRECTPRIFPYLYLYLYEHTYCNDNILMYRYIEDINLIETDNSNITSLPVDYPTTFELTKNLLFHNTVNILDLEIKLLENKRYLTFMTNVKVFN